MRKVVQVFLIFISQSVFSQIPLTITNNGMRSGDILCRVKTDYISAGEPGQNEVWSLAKAADENTESFQSIVCKGDTIAVFGKDCVQHYMLHGDTLCYKGMQQRSSYLIYDNERPLLRYPFAYGDSISGSFSGQGIDEGANSAVNGWGYSVVDGTGILTDGIDTLYNALRLHFHEEFINTHFSCDTVPVRFVNDSYAWFVAGYRYPVQESMCQFVADGDNLFPISSQTYLFLPDLQAELPYDPLNEAVLIALSDRMSSPQESFPLTEFKALVSTDGRCLDFSFLLSSECTVSIVACDVLGNILCSYHKANCSSGDWQESMVLSRKPVGNSLMVNVRCNEQVKSFKVNQ